MAWIETDPRTGFLKIGFLFYGGNSDINCGPLFTYHDFLPAFTLFF